MLIFLVATYNEEAEIVDLLTSVYGINNFVISDDGSTDNTVNLALEWAGTKLVENLTILRNEHTGLAETIKRKGVEHIRRVYGPNTWILMLDADERIDTDTLDQIRTFTNLETTPSNVTHIWFGLDEYIDERGPLRSFLKCRLFKAGYVWFSESVHEDDKFEGQGANFNWRVIHRKTSAKQMMREREYLNTYDKLLKAGKVTQEWVDRCKSFHYFVKE